MEACGSLEGLGRSKSSSARFLSFSGAENSKNRALELFRLGQEGLEACGSLEGLGRSKSTDERILHLGSLPSTSLQPEQLIASQDFDQYTTDTKLLFKIQGLRVLHTAFTKLDMQPKHLNLLYTPKPNSKSISKEHSAKHYTRQTLKAPSSLE